MTVLAIRAAINVIKELCSLAGIDKSRTTPYYSMGNGMVERFNQTLFNMLGTLESHKKNDWKWYIHITQLAMTVLVIILSFLCLAGTRDWPLMPI